MWSSFARSDPAFHSWFFPMTMKIKSAHLRSQYKIENQICFNTVTGWSAWGRKTTQPLICYLPGPSHFDLQRLGCRGCQQQLKMMHVKGWVSKSCLNPRFPNLITCAISIYLISWSQKVFIWNCWLGWTVVRGISICSKFPSAVWPTSTASTEKVSRSKLMVVFIHFFSSIVSYLEWKPVTAPNRWTKHSKAPASLGLAEVFRKRPVLRYSVWRLALLVNIWYFWFSSSWKRLIQII